MYSRTDSSVGAAPQTPDVDSATAVQPRVDPPDKALDMGATGCCADTARLLRELLTEGEA